MTTTRRSFLFPRRASLVAPLALLALSACAPIEAARHTAMNLIPGRAAPQTAPLTTALDNAAKPAAPVMAGFKARDLLTGDTISFDASRRGDVSTVRQSDGCVWTRRGDWFAPSSAWKDCEGGGAWASGGAEVRAVGSIWPLTYGAKGGFTRAATAATGKTLKRDTTCAVTGAESVLRESGARTPVWVVDCKDGKRTRTTWWAPGEGPIAFRKVHARNGVEEAWVRL